ncbi:hypothetical protein LRR81_08460 [Metabacillus sp. GX 13764]|uniref:hypothetical protein n=1 Tax=Metabacillus kandeliae TaxID=2900151 RepID=UPI001E3D5EE1|nr:hypothetical protein [Metabacillus kandeliae]MCD7034264.1 hypothetical protein [Metabacillus kandeliae]
MPDLVAVEARMAEVEEIFKKVDALRQYRTAVDEGLKEAVAGIQCLIKAEDHYLLQWKGKAAQAYQKQTAHFRELEKEIKNYGSSTSDEIDKEISRLLQELTAK